MSLPSCGWRFLVAELASQDRRARTNKCSHKKKKKERKSASWHDVTASLHAPSSDKKPLKTSVPRKSTDSSRESLSCRYSAEKIRRVSCMATAAATSACWMLRFRFFPPSFFLYFVFFFSFLPPKQILCRALYLLLYYCLADGHVMPYGARQPLLFLQRRPLLRELCTRKVLRLVLSCVYTYIWYRWKQRPCSRASIPMASLPKRVTLTKQVRSSRLALYNK